MFRWASRCPQISKTWALTESISDIRAYILSRRHKLRPVIRQTYTFFCTCLVAVVSGAFKELAWTSACALILYVKDKPEPLSSFLFKESHITDTGLPVPLSKVSNIVFILDNVLETASNLNLAGLGPCCDTSWSEVFSLRSSILGFKSLTQRARCASWRHSCRLRLP